MLSAAGSSDASLVTAVATAGYTLTHHMSMQKHISVIRLSKMSSVLQSRVQWSKP